MLNAPAKVVVTTTQAEKDIKGLEAFLADTGWQYVPRNRRSLKALRADTGAHAVLVWQAAGPVLYLEQGQFFFHPSMAKNRISQHRQHKTTDVMVRIMGVKPGDEVLDCTLGLGADAIVASYLVGDCGRVAGLESSPLVAATVKWGMRVYQTQMNWLEQAIRRVEVIQAEHCSYLQKLPARSYDVVYFDPMFRHPVMASQPLSPLRLLADYQPLTLEAIDAAIRVARRRVVVKERKGSQEFTRLGIDTVRGGESSRIAYGVIEVPRG